MQRLALGVVGVSLTLTLALAVGTVQLSAEEDQRARRRGSGSSSQATAPKPSAPSAAQRAVPRRSPHARPPRSTGDESRARVTPRRSPPEERPAPPVTSSRGDRTTRRRSPTVSSDLRPGAGRSSVVRRRRPESGRAGGQAVTGQTVNGQSRIIRRGTVTTRGGTRGGSGRVGQRPLESSSQIVNRRPPGDSRTVGRAVPRGSVAPAPAYGNRYDTPRYGYGTYLQSAIRAPLRLSLLLPPTIRLHPSPVRVLPPLRLPPRLRLVLLHAGVQRRCRHRVPDRLPPGGRRLRILGVRVPVRLWLLVRPGLRPCQLRPLRVGTGRCVHRFSSSEDAPAPRRGLRGRVLRRDRQRLRWHLPADPNRGGVARSSRFGRRATCRSSSRC